MDTATVVGLVKAGLGITSTVRDAYITAIVNGIIRELESEKGIVLVADDASHLIFVCDYATWRYQSRDDSGDMPRHLQYRLRNLIVKSAGAST
ncbi:MAG: hypothetical protein J7559_19650 [Cohnella sp.]|nr:hypothetical protein [Cohnella sp.]